MKYLQEKGLNYHTPIQMMILLDTYNDPTLYERLTANTPLKNIRSTDFYYNGTVALSDGTVQHGAPIVYGITIPKNAEHPDIAADFVRFVLSAEGQEIMQDNGQPPIVPAFTIVRDKTN